MKLTIEIYKVVEKIRRLVFLGFRFVRRNLKNPELYFEKRSWRKISSFVDDVDGPLQRSELIWLYNFIRSLPTDIQVIEINPGTGQITCCIAAASWLSRRRIFSLWPEDSGDPSSETGRLFINWHKTIIRKYLVPYVSPVLMTRMGPIPKLPTDTGLIFFNHDPLFPDWSNDLEKTLHLNMSGFWYGVEYATSVNLSKSFPGEVVQQKNDIYIVKSYKRRLSTDT